MKNKIFAFPRVVVTRFATLSFLVFTLLFSFPGYAQKKQNLNGHVLKILSQLKPVRKVSDTMTTDLIIGLPLRNRDAFNRLLDEMYDTASPNYHRYLKPEEYIERFCPTTADYQTLQNWAKANKLKIVKTQPDRKILHVRAPAKTVEKVFHVTLNYYKHPLEKREFYATNKEPYIDLNIPISFISGLNDYDVLRNNQHDSAKLKTMAAVAHNESSGSSAYLTGSDFRKAYAPGVTLTGAGQVVGVLEFGGYFKSDIQAYEAENGIRDVPIQNVYVDGYTGTPDLGAGWIQNLESSADIELVLSMAPGLTALSVYGANYAAGLQDILHEMAFPTQGEPLPSILTTSYYFFYDPNVDDALDQISAEGISFFVASGDWGSYDETTGGGDHPPADYPLLTSVGGTLLSTGPAGEWLSERAVNFSGGGYSPWSADPHFAIPTWQQNLNFDLKGGSNVTRNCPDVSMIAGNITVISANGVHNFFAGTSASAPLWAGFTALVNEQCASLGFPPIGTLNRTLYTLATGFFHSLCFHDIVSGDNTNATNPTKYQTFPGYDLVTGWGSPTGINLINYLAVRSKYQSNPRVILQFIGQSRCSPGAIAGQNVTIAATVTGLASPLSYTWTVTNATTIGGGTGTSPTITVGVPSSGPSSNVLLTVNDPLGIRASATLGFEGIDPALAVKERRLCEILIDLYQFIRPIHIWPGDPEPGKFLLERYTPEEMENLRKINAELGRQLDGMLEKK